MISIRQHDEALVDALHLLRAGRSLHAAARILHKDVSNLSKSVRAVLAEDLAHDETDTVLPHYPNFLIKRLTSQ